MQQALFGGGCFWCVEAVYLELQGIHKVTSGYAGGDTDNPTYEDICRGDTNHAEVILIDFDETQISYAQLLDVFFATHDPTTLNRQGNDVGTQYRSGIYYHTEEQKKIALEIIKALNESKAYDRPIVTEVAAVATFYPAEDYHQNYFNDNTNQPYCQYVIRPKLDKFKKVFKDKLK
jgi:peptide-methionine (S)-S-oxide reductase